MMKMSEEHYARLKNMIYDMLSTSEESFFERRLRYHEQSLSEVRFSWDLVWALPQAERTAWFDEIYSPEFDLTDLHVSTALRRIVAELGVTKVPDNGQTIYQNLPAKFIAIEFLHDANYAVLEITDGYARGDRVYVSPEDIARPKGTEMLTPPLSPSF